VGLSARLRALRREDPTSVLSDPAWAAVRARVVWGCGFMIALVVASCNLLNSPDYPIRAHPEVGIAVPVVLTLHGLWALLRGPRITDPELMAIFLTWPMMVAVSFVALQRPGSYLAGEWSVMVSAVIVALIAGRTAWVALMALVVSGCMSWIVWNRLAPTGLAPITIVIDVTTLNTVIFAFRAVRDVATRALARAGRGEVTDPLTQLANRRGLERHGPATWNRQARAARPLAVLLIDIDQFKEINDTCGHAAGDDVIRRVAAIMSSTTREGDVAVRLGGEEFAIFLAATLDTALMVAERIRRTVQEQLGNVTVSVGVHQHEPGPADPMPDSLWAAVDAADRALYTAKHSGRNRVVTTTGQCLPAAGDGCSAIPHSRHPRAVR